jgi:hypothetical protein
MKTLAILLAAVSLNLAACATDDDSYRDGEAGLRPAYKPALGDTIATDKLPDDGTDIDETIDVDGSFGGIDQRWEDLEDGGHLGEYAEEVLLEGEPATVIHRGGLLLIVDEEGNVIRRIER